MKSAEFFDATESAPVARTFAAVRQAFDQHAKTLETHAASPWTLRLGKGGGDHPSPEQSLYRHCMEVAVLAAWLFYHAWREGRPPLAAIDDPVPALRTVFAIAFAHDADKRVGDGRSRSPSAEDVAVVYAELGMASWSGLSLEALCTAVSRVENRGLENALAGTSLLDLLESKLAEFVREGDNLLSRAARQGGSTAAFIAILNQDLPRLRRLYGVPEQPLRLLRFRHHPVVLHRLHSFLSYRLYSVDAYPLVLVRQGDRLEAGIAEAIAPELADWLDQFEDYLADAEPSLKVNPTTGTVTPFNIGESDDLARAVLAGGTRQAELLLRVSAKDWEAVAHLVNFWVMRGGAPLATAAPKGSLCPALKAEGEVKPRHCFWRAAALAAAQAMGGKGAPDRLLAWPGMAADWSGHGIEAGQLDGLSLRTLAALQASMLLEDDGDFHACLNEVHGPWREKPALDPGARAIVQGLKAQVGLGGADRRADPYTKPAKGGVCLVCGTPSERPIETGTMKLAGIKATSFGNRIGHEKHLWSERGENYLCPACVRIQGLLLEAQPGLRGTPMLVATPVRHLLDTCGGDQQNSVLRGYDAVSKDGHRKVLPWNADAGFDEPLLFEERPKAFEETVDHMHRLARYAALSGEPVHAFVASPRACRAAFLYEGMPELLKELLADITAPEGGVSRAHLHRLALRLDLFLALLRENDGMAAMQALPRFGWWAAAFVLGRAARQAKGGWSQGITHHVAAMREEYPMNPYDQWLDALVRLSVDIHQPDIRNATGAEWTLPLRTALQTYQKHYAFGPGGTQDAIAQSLRANLSRRFDHRRTKDLDERLQTFAEAAYGLLAKAQEEFDLESGFLRFLFAAYEGGYRREVAEYWKHNKAAAPYPNPWSLSMSASFETLYAQLARQIQARYELADTPYDIPALPEAQCIVIPLVREAIAPILVRNNDADEITDMVFEDAQGSRVNRVRIIASKTKGVERRRGAQILRAMGMGGWTAANKAAVPKGKKPGEVFDLNSLVFGDSGMIDEGGKKFVAPIHAAVLYSDAISVQPKREIIHSVFRQGGIAEDGGNFDAEGHQSSNNIFTTYAVNPGALFVQSLVLPGRRLTREGLDHLLLSIGLTGAYGGATAVTGTNLRTRCLGIYWGRLERAVNAPGEMLKAIGAARDAEGVVRALEQAFAAAYPHAIARETMEKALDALIGEFESGSPELLARYAAAKDQAAALFDAWFGKPASEKKKAKAGA
jgi:hypothetical protein